ncbi:hypothetical protein [Formosa sp. PL04]|uniref:hypothetical protein n=1 Tax=Formosa sp. PL04 TaxID=3081755 RepID=UPI002982933A|nr:hypothetical protein [Formosa sp. PL04]MDW5290346.1 hypothetical protein [Formosa sp. PL04]
MSPLASALIYFIGIMIILWPLQILSAKTLGQSIHFDALVEFNDHDIIINHTNKDSIETKDWNWVKTIELKKDRIWLTLNLSRPFGISIPKSKLDQSQIDFFKHKMKMKNDRKQ